MRNVHFSKARLAVAGLMLATSMVSFAGLARAQSSLDSYDRKNDTRVNGGVNEATLRFEGLWRNDPGQQNAAYEAALRFAKCARNIGGSQAENLLATDFHSPAETSAIRTLAKRNSVCVNGVSSVPSPYFRGALAESLIAESDAGDVKDLAPSVTSDEVTKFLATSGAKSTGDDLYAKLRKVAGCQAALAPGLSRKVIATEVGSDAERAAFTRLYAVEPRCAGATFSDKVSVTLQRAFLADMVYQWDRYEKNKHG